MKYLLAVVGVLTPILAAESLAARPNVVLILVDDLGWRDLGVTGSDFYETPHVDGLFRSGVWFERSYASSRVCSPTRASLMTGQSPARHGITDWIGAPEGIEWKRNTPSLPPKYAHALPADDTTLAEAFKEAGYATFFAGKWHLGGEGSLPTDHGFDINLGGHHRGSPPGGYFSPYGNPYLEDGPTGEHLPLRLARETADFVEAERNEPFFAMLSFYSVHGPLQTTRERWVANRLQALAKGDPGKRFGFDRLLHYRIVQDHPVYAGMVEAMDDAVGIVLDALRRSGQREDTIVVFTSDNGGVSSGDGRATSNLPLRGGKGKQWEAGTRVPLAIAWPGTIEGDQNKLAPTTTADIYPTLLDLSGLSLKPEQHADGVSLAPAMCGELPPERPLFWHYPHYGNQGGEPSSVIIDENWKLIRYHEDGREELYFAPWRMKERIDLADQRGDTVARLSKQLDAYLAATGAKMATVNAGFDAAKATAQLRRLRSAVVQREE
ncbi:MAG: sulfatase, partial [Planctomycetota bacterium]